jgi:uncharacterized membrane protein (DUF2068 family)
MQGMEAPLGAVVMRAMRPRPLGIVVIVVFELVNAVSFLLAANTSLPGLGESGLTQMSERSDLGRVAADVFGVLAIVAVIGLWFLSRRAWVLTMVLVGIALVFGLYSWWLGTPNYPRLLLNAIIALYLNQSAVREAVADRRRKPVMAA